MEWEIISQNPNFMSALANDPRVGPDPKAWYSRLRPEIQKSLAESFMPKSGTVAEPILNPNMAQTISQINRPALDQVQPLVAADNGVLAGGFNADGVAIGTNMEADVDPNKGFVPVTVGSGMSMGVVMYNPETGAVMPVEGNNVSNLIARNPNVQNIAMEAYNNRVNAPVLEAKKNLNTAQGIIDATDGQVSGPVLEQYTDAKRNLTEAQRRAMSNMSDPSAVDIAANRPSYETPVLSGLEEFEATNTPYVRPTVVNNPNVPEVFPNPNLPNVDFADPTMAPTNALNAGPVLINDNKPNLPFNTYSENGVLTDNSAPNTVTNSGILGTGTSNRTSGGPSVRSIMGSSGMKTSNRRGSNIPNMLIDRNESLIRIGGAMYGGALQGNGITAATEAYGNIQDANRKADAARFKIEEARRLAAAKAASRGGGGRGGKGKGMTSNQVSDVMFNYQKALNAIRDSRAAGGNLTGIGGIAKSFVDSFTGDDDAARRLILSRVKIDDTLLRVAETKGAISNAEMKLFLEPAPKNYEDEAIWEAWILDRMEALQRVQSRLDANYELPTTERSSSSNVSTQSGSGDGQYTVEQIAD